MLFLKIRYHLFRNWSRTLLLICTAAALCGCIAFFTHNVQANRRALEQLSLSSPATLRLTNSVMNTFDELNVRGEDADRLVELGIGDINASSKVVGFWKTSFGDGNLSDVELLAVTDIDTIGFSSQEGIEYVPGTDSSFLEGDEPLVLMSREFAEENSFSLGDSISLQLQQRLFSSQQMEGAFRLISEEKLSLQVAGIFDENSGAANAADLYLPSLWLRAQVEKAGMDFYYNSFSGSLRDSMKLNEFKAKLAEYGYRQPMAMVPQTDREMLGLDRSAATTAVMEDKAFIRAAEKLGTSLQYYRILSVPLLILFAGMAVLSVFLVLRGARLDMAVSRSLGETRAMVAASHFLALLAAQIAGCVLILPPLLLLGCSWGELLFAYGVFLVCALFGNAVGLSILLRFEPMALLVRSE